MLRWLTDAIAPRPLGLARIMIAGASLIKVFVTWPVLSKLTEDDTLLIPYFSWMPSPGAGLVGAIVVSWIVASVLLMVGWRLPISCALLLATIVLTLGLDQQLYSNHLYLMSWLVFLLAVADGGAGINLRRRVRPVTRWPVVLLMLQASIVYGISALSKINAEFLSGTALAATLRDGLVPFPEALRTPKILLVAGVVTVLVEAFVAIGLWSKRFRPAAFVLGFGLHLSIVLFIDATGELIVFAIEMLALYPLFLETDRLSVAVPTTEAHTWQRRLQLFDVLRLVDMRVGGNTGQMVLGQGARQWSGKAASTRVFEHLIPWLWVAPLLRLRELSGSRENEPSRQ